MEIKSGDFVWNRNKEIQNVKKHGVDFHTAALVFKDVARKIFTDELHSRHEDRLFCVGKVNGRPLTVRFIYRGGKIRIFGAGYWRKGAKYYEKND